MTIYTMDLPEADLAASPFTGYARRHWEQIADHLLLSIRPYASPNHSLVSPPGPASVSGPWSDQLEGFARTFLLAAFRVAGAGGADPHGIIDWYARGLAAGTDPGSPERWPTLIERRQARVEAASIAIALHETRPWLWDRLDDRTRALVVEWLAPFVGTRGYSNNWIWFQNVSEAFLRTVGGPWSAEDIEHNLALHESWYAGDGWYSDGASSDGLLQNFDYYSGWAMHFYPLWYSRIVAETPSTADRDRLRQYLAGAQHFVSADGAPVFQGRSLTYRYAMLAPFWVGALFDATPLPPGRTRRLASGVLRHFVERGAVDANGLLPVGWHGAYPGVRQRYTGSGSPYWSSKGFAGLLLPADHDVWTAREEPLAVEDGDIVVSLRMPGWIVSATRGDGIVRVANHGSDHRSERCSHLDDPFYARHGYSSHAGPELGDTGHREPSDSHVALVNTEGRLSHRGRIDRVAQGENAAVSRCRALWLAGPDDRVDSRNGSAAWPSLRTGPWLTTASVLRGAMEVRLVRVESGLPVDDGPDGGPPAGDPDAYWPRAVGPWRLHIGSWALAADQPPDVSADNVAAWARRPDGIVSAIRNLRGLDSAGTTTSEGTNALGRHSAVPWLRTSQPAVPGEVYAAAIVLSGDGADADAVDRVEHEPDTDDDIVRVHWRDGHVDVVRLATDS